MAKLDGESKLYYHDEVKDFVAAGIARLKLQTDKFRIDRIVVRPLSSGYRITYKGSWK